MAKRRRLVLGPHPKGGWQLKWQGGKQAVRRLETKEEALAAGRALARRGTPSQLQIRKGDGKIQDEHTYGQDPEEYPD